MPEQTRPLFVGVDIGTYETKGVVVDGDGALVAQARRRHAPVVSEGGRVEHDADSVWWDGVCAVVRELMEHADVAPAAVAGVGCSGIGPCVLPVTADLAPLGPAALYGIDTRSGAEVVELEHRLGADAVVARCGNRLTSQSAGPKILWLQRHEPQVHAAARWFLTSQSYVVARLTGEVVIDHATASYFHPLYDPTAAAWDTSGCEDFVDVTRLPRLGWASEVAGAVTPAAAAATGLPAGVPVVFGTADAQAEAYACGVLEVGDLMVMYGSSSFMVRLVDAPSRDVTTWNAPFLFEGTHATSAGTAAAGTVTRWVATLLGLEGADEDVFAQLTALADSADPGTGGLLALPYLAGERTPLHDPGAQGVLAGLTLHHGRAEVARAAVEGVAHSMADCLDTLARSAPLPETVTALGGGTRNHVWLQAVSDISGRAQQVVLGPGASFGDAALAAVGTGALDGPGGIRSWIRVGRTVAPRPELADLYRADHERFGALYRATRGLLTSAPTHPEPPAPANEDRA